MDLKKLVDDNQTIKIIPSFEEDLRSYGLNTDLDQATKVWFELLLSMWKTMKKSPITEQKIESFYYLKHTDVHRIALILVVNSNEFKDCKPKTLPYTLIEVLNKWSKNVDISPDESLKIPAFRIATKQRNQQFLSLIIDTYCLNTIKEDVVQIVKDLIKSGNHKKACLIVTAMKLYNEISMKDLLFPLVLQDSINVIDEYLTSCPKEAEKIVLFLDELLDKQINLLEYVQQYNEEHKIANIKYDKMHHKPLGKLVARICNKFKLPIEMCTNLRKNRTAGALKFLVYQRYQDHNVSKPVWDDLVKDSLDQDSGSALGFIDVLAQFDPKEAMKWAEYINLPKNDYPVEIRDLDGSSSKPICESDNWETAEIPQYVPEYYKLKLPLEKITIVDTSEKFYDMMTSDLCKNDVISIDCEWKPSFGAKQLQVALIQVATSEEIYLIDTMMLNDEQYSSFWYRFCKSILSNPEIIKVGFGLENDLKEIKGSVKALNTIKIKGEGFLDLALVWKSVINCGLILPNSNIAGQSLSSLVETCFGLPLAKDEQCSNWELRPLRQSQIQYAALDSYVLLEVYYYLQDACSIQGISFEEICNKAMLENKQKTSRKKVADTLKQSLLRFSPQEKSCKDIKFLVDVKIKDVILVLRYFGIDTIIIPSTMLWHDVVNLAISEDRLILLQTIKHTPTVNFPQSSIFDVGVCPFNEQIKKIIEHFNIVVRKSDILRHCVYCNGIDFKDICYADIAGQLNENYSHSNKNFIPIDEDEDNINAFLDECDDDTDLYQPIRNSNSYERPVTSKGVPIQIENLNSFREYNKPATLCESCGIIFWFDELLQDVKTLVNDIVVS